MKITAYNPKYYVSPAFGTNCRSYTKDNKTIGTQTFMFREDLDWNAFSNFITKHFKAKDKVNIIQFASSDGSEAYTQIISLLENHKDADKFFPIQAYDIDNEVLQAAKSGIINIDNADKKAFKNNRIIFEKYFSNENDRLLIQNDKLVNCKSLNSYVVSNKLTSRVKFNHGNMFDIAKNIKDESNTIILCRNILGYFSDSETDSFLNTISSKLKSGSIFVVGFDDTKNKLFDRLLRYKSFKPVMENVYRRI